MEGHPLTIGVDPKYIARLFSPFLKVGRLTEPFPSRLFSPFLNLVMPARRVWRAQPVVQIGLN